MEAALLPAEGSEVEGSVSPGPTPPQMQDGVIPPEYCSFRGAGPALPYPCYHRQFSCIVQARGRANSPALSRFGMGPALHSPWTSALSQVVAQTRDIHLVFGGNRPLLLQGPRPRHDPWRLHGPEHHHGLSSGYSQGVPPLPHISHSVSRHSAQTILLLFLACLSPTY